MILPALVSLYDRLTADPATNAVLPRHGYSVQGIAFSVVIDLEGRLVQIRDEREQSRKKRVPRDVLCPGQAKSPGAGINPNLFWDQPTYLLGFCVDAANEKKRARAPREFAAFRERHLALEAEIAATEFRALCRFLSAWDPEAVDAHPGLQFLRNEKVTGFGAFRVAGRTEWLHDTPVLRTWWETTGSKPDSTDATTGQCLVTAHDGVPLARLHEPKIKGVAGAQSMGAALVSFNCDAFTSYGKDQSLNAPVSELAAFKYATALNWLLGGPRPQRLRLGDTTIVFWTEKPTTAESLLGLLLGGAAPDDPSAQDATLQQKLAVFLETLRQGGGRLAALGDDEATPFYILGLAPNAARVSVRFWHAGTLGDLHRNLKRHADDLAVQSEYPNDPAFPPLWFLLRETARTSDDVAPLLGGALARAVITGGLYPVALAAAIVRRIRADTGHVPYLRAAILKAFLVRNCQNQLTMSLDTANPDPAYRLGRLFAALEKTQRDALGETNTSVRERFYAAASATPAAVFPRILRTYTHHLAKLDGGLKVVREQLVQEIMDAISAELPPSLSLEQQGRFALGYYHQMRAFFTKRNATESAA